MNPLDEIEQHYPEIIDSMPKRFNSHEFILELAYRHQGLYINVLARYADSKSPFMSAHVQLAKRLNKFDDLVKALDYESSINIFGHTSDAMVWSKK